MLVKTFESVFLRFLGKYSYGMYVVQLPLVTLVPLASVASLLPRDAITQSVLYFIVMFALIIIIAVLSYHLLESHFLRLKKVFE